MLQLPTEELAQLADDLRHRDEGAFNDWAEEAPRRVPIRIEDACSVRLALKVLCSHADEGVARVVTQRHA